MPWKETCAVEQRKAFIDQWLRRDGPMIELCCLYGVSRKTGYKWVERFKAGGWAGLSDASRRPHSAEEMVCHEAMEAVVQLRREHPSWGPRKLLQVLGTAKPELSLPSHSTVSRRFAAQGLSQRRKRAHRPDSYCSPYDGYYGPNASWSADFKGHHRLTATQQDCHPLTIQDVTSRFVLAIDAMTAQRLTTTRTAFARAFGQYGLPDVIRTDNGTPFASQAPGGLSALSVWWIRLGIVPERIQPGRPTQNSRHERMHRTLKEDCPRAATLGQQQRHYDQFRQVFNNDRPHQSLAGDVPAARYVPSPRSYPTKLRDPVYHDKLFIERVGSNGALRFQGATRPISLILANQLLGLKRVDARIWKVFFGPVYLGYLDMKGFHADRKWRPRHPTPPVTHV